MDLLAERTEQRDRKRKMKIEVLTGVVAMVEGLGISDYAWANEATWL